MTLPAALRALAERPIEERRYLIEELKHMRWRVGELEYLTRPGAQRDMYRRAHEQIERFPGVPEPLVYLCHRQLGKSHMSVLLNVERCIRQPGAKCCFGMDTLENAFEIWNDKIGAVIADMPPEFSMWTRKSLVFFRASFWPRGVVSRVELRGLDYRKGDGIRGRNYDQVTLDEARNIGFLQHVIKNVINPSWRGAKEPLFLLLSTPPPVLDHDFTLYYNRAEKNDSLVTIPASRNPDFTEADRRMLLPEYESENDIHWRRELECEMIADTTRLVIPEWIEAREECLVEVVPRPAYYRGYVTIDHGWRDHTGALFSLYDFEARRLGVLNELFVNYTPIDEIGQLLIEKIENTFPEHVRQDLIIRADAKDIELDELNKVLRPRGYWALPMREKYDRDAAINALRSSIVKGRVIIQENCIVTDRTLLNAIWNQKRKDFERSKSIGHADLLAALNYQHRTIYWDDNPIPVEKPRLSHKVGYPADVHERREEEDALLAMFGKKR